jgi:arylsulfatase A-like enzyme
MAVRTWAIGLWVAAVTGCADATPPPSRPNILWITSEDNGPHLGAYGDLDAVTPYLDRLAKRGLRYTNVWSTAPVCAPARTALITGMYPESTGGEHMRSLVRLPEGVRMFPALLRQAGYYTTNNTKQDYNVMEAGDAPGDGVTAPAWRPGAAPGSVPSEVQTSGVWDDSSATAHWRNRAPGQPFFAVFNLMETHESFIHRKAAPTRHDPSTIRIPSYMPDLPEVRSDWAAYHDNMTTMDALAGGLLAELDAAGVAEDTVVFYFGDNGPGLPRSKRFVQHSGLHVPLIVHVPAKHRDLAPDGYAAGASSDRLIGFVDMAPTVLGLAGVAVPSHVQGQAFMGPAAAPAPQYAFGVRARMDERYDLLRSVRDERFVYIRNYMPHRPAGQYTWYGVLMPSWQAWKQHYDQGRLAPPQTAFWETKPSEELYDLRADPDEVRNLAAIPEHHGPRDRLRAALEAHALEVRDLGFLPEYMLHRVPVPYDYGHDRGRYDLEAIRASAGQATDAATPLAAVRAALAHADPAVRYWAAVGMIVRGRSAVSITEAELVRLLGDHDPGPRIAAAEALGRYGAPAARARALDTLVTLGDAAKNEEYVALLALNALVHVPELPAGVRAAVGRLPRGAARSRQRANNIQYVIDQIVKGLV